MVKESTMVIKDMPTMIVTPLSTLVLQLLVFLFFVALVLYLGTAEITRAALAGNTVPATGSTFEQQMAAYNKSLADGSLNPTGGDTDHTETYIYLYVALGFLWNVFFIQDFAFVSLSGAVSFCSSSARTRTKRPSS